MSDVRERHVVSCDCSECQSDLRCDECDQPWPCDAIREADRADAAEADSERLAAALRLVKQWRLSGFTGVPWANVTKALAAHDARKNR